MAWLGQWCAGLAVACGIGIELSLHADLGFILITAGSLGFAMATKYRHERK